MLSMPIVPEVSHTLIRNCLIQIGGIKREKKAKEKEMAVAE